MPYLALVPRTPTVRLTREGERATITLEAAADRPVPDWMVSALDLSGLHDRQQYVHVSLDRGQAAPGDTVVLTMTLRK